MCYYSGAEEGSREAKIGEQLILTQLPHSKGFTGIKNNRTAVCMRKPSLLYITEARQGKHPIAQFEEVVFIPGNETKGSDKVIAKDACWTTTLNELPVGILVEVISLNAEIPQLPALATTTAPPRRRTAREQTTQLVTQIIG